MEFDKSRCYSAINADELRAGDKVIVDYDIAHLKEQVKLGVFYLPIKKINAEDSTCRFNVGDGNDYPLAYLVERTENCTNCGKASCGHSGIQGLEYKTCEYWKPKTEKHYRPFRDTDELIKVFCEKTPKIYDKDDEKLFMPYIWVRLKDSQIRDLITGFGRTGVQINAELVDWGELFNEYEFLDGSPCGVEE